MLKIKILKKSFYQDMNSFEEEVNQFCYSLDKEVKSMQFFSHTSPRAENDGLFCAITYEKIKDSNGNE